MPGFSTAAVITESGLFLRVNDKNKFMNGKTALEKLTEIHEAHLNGSFLMLKNTSRELQCLLNMVHIVFIVFQILL